MLRKIAFMLLSSALVLTACKKDQEEQVDVNDPFKLLTQKSWKLVLNDSNPASNPTTGTNTYYPVQDCEKDNTYQFNTANELIYNHGSIACPNVTEIPKTSYQANFSTKKLTIGQNTYDILELSATRLKLAAAVALAGGSSNLIFLYEHPL